MCQLCVFSIRNFDTYLSLQFIITIIIKSWSKIKHSYAEEEFIDLHINSNARYCRWQIEVLQNKCSSKSRKFHKKTPVLEFCKSMDWFLCDRDLRPERLKVNVSLCAKLLTYFMPLVSFSTPWKLEVFWCFGGQGKRPMTWNGLLEGFILKQYTLRSYSKSSRKEKEDQWCSIKKDVLKSLAKFTEKHLCQSLFFNKAVRSAWSGGLI